MACNALSITEPSIGWYEETAKLTDAPAYQGVERSAYFSGSNDRSWTLPTILSRLPHQPYPLWPLPWPYWRYPHSPILPAGNVALNQLPEYVRQEARYVLVYPVTSRGFRGRRDHHESNIHHGIAKRRIAQGFIVAYDSGKHIPLLVIYLLILCAFWTNQNRLKLKTRLQVNNIK